MARVVKAGCAAGRALVSSEPIGFLGGVDPETGMVVEAGHDLEGQCVAGRVLVFPTGKGSTVGSYTIYRLARAGLAPVAIINAEADPVVAVGAIIAEVPMVDQVDITCICNGDWVQVHDGEVIVQEGPVWPSILE
jgi:predicted aconitase with swiveling domain